MTRGRPAASSADFDVVVVGGGLAGWTAASRARELGAKVLLIERSRRVPGWGNSMVSGGALHAVLGRPDLPPDELVRKAVAETDGHGDPVVTRAWAARARSAVEWVSAHGGDVVRDGSMPHRTAVFAPVRRTEPGLEASRFGTARFLRHLARTFLDAGGTIWQPARARTLVRTTSGGWQVGAVTDAGRETCTADSVILADGGFQANRQLLRRYVGTDQVRRRATSMSTGDALQMGISVGAAVVNMEGFYGHLLARESLTDRRLWPYPTLDSLARTGVVVDPTGRRIVDEHHSGVGTTNAVAHCAYPDGCWLIFDDAAWNTAGKVGDTPPNPYLPDNGGTVLRASSIEELAKVTGLPRTALVASVKEVLASPGRATPPRSVSPSLAQAPFHAVPIVAGVSFTLGGLRVDGDGRVLDTTGGVLGGLYAAGGTMGGLHGGPRSGYVGGLLEAAVFGLIAGEHAAGRTKQDVSGTVTDLDSKVTSTRAMKGHHQ